MFDIPENNRSARRALRIKLDQLGFAKYQKSVFIYPYSCRDEINFILNYFNVKNFVNYIVARKIDNEKI